MMLEKKKKKKIVEQKKQEKGEKSLLRSVFPWLDHFMN